MATLDGIGRSMAGQHPSLKWAYLLIAMAMMIEMVVLVVGITVGFLADDYYSNTKAVRDAGAAGLLSDLGTIMAIPAWLEPLKFLGLAIFFAGIAVVLAITIKTIQTRGQAMELALPLILGRRADATTEDA